MINEVKQTGPDEVIIIYDDGNEVKMAAHVWNIRVITIKNGLEWEIRFPGGKLARNAPSCFTIIRNEFGIRGRDKLARYQEFCKLFNLEPKSFLKVV